MRTKMPRARQEMTRSVRYGVIHLLRCAADAAISGNFSVRPSWSTPRRLGLGRHVCVLATRAAQHVAWDTGRSVDKAPDADEYAIVMLEAARRVEERSWP